MHPSSPPAQGAAPGSRVRSTTDDCTQHFRTKYTDFYQSPKLETSSQLINTLQSMELKPKSSTRYRGHTLTELAHKPVSTPKVPIGEAHTQVRQRSTSGKMAAAGLNVKCNALVGGRAGARQSIHHAGVSAHIPAQNVWVPPSARVQVVATSREHYLKTAPNHPSTLTRTLLCKFSADSCSSNQKYEELRFSSSWIGTRCTGTRCKLIPDSSTAGEVC